MDAMNNECSHISSNIMLIKNNFFASLVTSHMTVHSNMITPLSRRRSCLLCISLNSQDTSEERRHVY